MKQNEFGARLHAVRRTVQMGQEVKSTFRPQRIADEEFNKAVVNLTADSCTIALVAHV